MKTYNAILLAVAVVAKTVPMIARTSGHVSMRRVHIKRKKFVMLAIFTSWEMPARSPFGPSRMPDLFMKIRLLGSADLVRVYSKERQGQCAPGRYQDEK